MYRHHKKNAKKNKGKVFLQSSQIKYSPFELRDTFRIFRTPTRTNEIKKLTRSISSIKGKD